MVYAASKAAIRSLARTLAAELLERNTRVNVVSPGPIDTPLYDKRRRVALTSREKSVGARAAPSAEDRS